MKRMKRIGLTLLSVLGLMMCPSAFAENAHAYSGSYCRASSGQQSGDFSYSGGTYNRASQVRLVTCPILVDEIAKTSGTTRVWVHFSGSGNFSCWLYSRNANGTTRQLRIGHRTGTGWLSIPNITR